MPTRANHTLVVYGRRRSHGGEPPVLPMEAGSKPTPIPRQGLAPDEIRSGGNQSAHQSKSTDVQRLRPLPYTTSSLFLITHSTSGRSTTS